MKEKSNFPSLGPKQPSDRLRPWLLCGMMALFVARPLFPGESAASYGDGLTMVMLWIVLAVCWLLGAIGRPRFAIRFGCTDAAVLLLIGCHTAAALWAIKHVTPRPAINMLWEWVGMGLCFLLARQLVVTAREARAVAAVMIALAVALSGYGLYQYGYEMPQTRAMYEANPNRALRDAGLWFPPGSPERQLFANRLNSTEPIATFALTNSLAGYLAPWLVVLLGVGFVSLRDRKRLLSLTFLAIPIALCLLLTKSRSGYIATGVGLVLVWLTCRERRIHIGWKIPAAIAGLAALLIAAVVAIGGLDREVLSQASKSFGYRWQYWQSSVRMIADHPVMGCGPGNFQNAYSAYKLPEASEEVADPHNFLLEIWATAGTPTMLAMLAVLGCFLRAEGSSGEWRVESGELSNPPSASNPQSLIPNPSPDAWAYVLAGGMLGFLLSIPLGMLSAAPPGAAAVLLGFPLAAIAVALMFGWIRDGRLPGLLPAVGVMVLLVNLLAAGGIGLPSVAGTLWLLLALGLRGDEPRLLRGWAAGAALVVVMALALACYGTAYSPVLGCQAQLRLAERKPAQAVEHLEAAAAADPLSAEAWRQLAAVEFEDWWQRPSKEAFAHFERAADKALELAPNSATTWLTVGDWYFRAASRADPAREKARADYRRAVQLYPNSALCWAKLAEASRAMGDRSAFRREAETALGLDEATPHIDKKLPAELRDRLANGLKDTR